MSSYGNWQARYLTWLKSCSSWAILSLKPAVLLLLSLLSPLPKIANCGAVCASQLVPLQYKPQEDDDGDDYEKL